MKERPLQNMTMSCPNCDGELEQKDEGYVCESCKNKFIRIEGSVYINKNLLSKAIEITRDTDEKLREIAQNKGIDNLVGSEGEVTGVVSGRKFGKNVFINDFIVTGESPKFSTDPIFAVNEKMENSPLLRQLKKFLNENKDIRLRWLFESELEDLRVKCGWEKKKFYEEIKRLIEEGDKYKIGEFHSHESLATSASDPDIRIFSWRDPEIDSPDYCIDVIISGLLMVFEHGTARKLGEMMLINNYGEFE